VELLDYKLVLLVVTGPLWWPFFKYLWELVDPYDRQGRRSDWIRDDPLIELPWPEYRRAQEARRTPGRARVVSLADARVEPEPAAEEPPAIRPSRSRRRARSRRPAVRRTSF